MYYSQLGQDKFVDQYLGGMRGGVFVDVGAHDGVTYSNTAFLEYERGWTGLCIEPAEKPFCALTRTRPGSTVRNCAVWDTDGAVNFLEVTSDRVNTAMLSGVISAYHPRHPPRIDEEIIAYGGSKEIGRVAAHRLDTLLTDHEITHVDYVSIDVEGSELAVLRTFDPRKLGVKILTIENNYRDEAITKAMRAAGYRLLAKIDYDDVYVPEGLGG